MADLRYEKLPFGLRGGLERYIERGIPPGSFLLAVLSNDLCEACARADDVNRHLLWDVVGWLWNEAPSPCWGSPGKVAIWIAERHRDREEAGNG